MNQTYTVQRGDTLYSISQKHNMTMEELMNLNNLPSTFLQVGQVLNVGYTPMDAVWYTVVSGDNLYNLAKKYDTTVAEIKALNNLNSDLLSIGQVLQIPYTFVQEEITPFTTYRVQKGDSLYSIAQKYGTTVDNLKNANNLTSNLLTIGQELVVPSTTTMMVEECFGEPFEETDTETITYTVQRGDNLYTIARKYNVSVSDLINFNNLPSTTLQIGEQLQIPTTTTTNQTYTVQRGDNLYTIARKFNTTVDAIKQKNNLTSNLLNIGQVLYI